MSIKILERKTENYPRNLEKVSRKIGDDKIRLDQPVVNRVESPAPAKLYLSGQMSNTERTSHLAIIGSRSMPEGSRDVIEAFVPGLIQLFSSKYPHVTLSIISGMTIGGDATAQWSALSAADSDNNVHVLGVGATSINHPHRFADLDLFHALSNTNLSGVLSEYPPQNSKQKEKYYDRNRLTAWMSGCVLIYGVSKISSGAMHTMTLARFAGIPVLYLPNTISKSVDAELRKRGCVSITQPGEFIRFFSRG